MSLFNDVQQKMSKELDSFGKGDVSPTTLALSTYAGFGDERIEPHVRYGCLEHFKSIARALLRNRFDDEGEENPIYQRDMFSGRLQERYPLRRKEGEEPIYRARESCSKDDLMWNVECLQKSADARLRHADALRAYAQDRA